MIKYFTLLFLCFAITTMPALAQNTYGTLQGHILTSDGKPAQGVAVALLNTSYGAITQANGQYRIKVKTGNYILESKALGMVSKQVPVIINADKVTTPADMILEVSSFQLKDVVVTGQYEPQSLKNSVYMVRTISSEQIRLRNASKVQDVLSDQLGVRFTNDLTLGTSDISLMGVSGQRVKILLDGVPLLDRGDTRESLNQVDINAIDHIEIVEGPMSVSYGSDALGGVINLITKRGTGGENIRVNARIQEESAGKEYGAFKQSGNHQLNAGINWEHKGWQLSGNFTRNNFDGAKLDWRPKDQLLGGVVAGYRTNNLHLWYRFDGEDETLKNDAPVNANNIEIDQHYLTNRWMHQLQADWSVNDKLSFSGAASYTDYSRRTQTTSLDVLTGDRRLTLGTGEQDKSVFDTKFFRGTAQYKLNNQVSIQPGVEMNLTGSTGARITGSPTINDYAFFISSEVLLTPALSIRPGARFSSNSVYKAPPVIPSLNTKIKLNSDLDLRLAYARGFRAPALRELYFNFHDASHSIDGNNQLKAEYSNSFNGSLSWQSLNTTAVKVRSSAGGFYNYFDQMITTGYNPADLSVMTYINIDKFKTTGGTFENTLNYKSLLFKLGFSYTGVYNRLQETDTSLPGFVWYPEVNTNLLYHFNKIKTDLSLFYKYNGKMPTYELDPSGGTSNIHLAQRAAFHMADLTVNKYINHLVTLSGGVKNLFNVTRVNNTSVDLGGAHSSGGPVPMGYGRSFFLGLTFQYSKY